MGDLHLSGALTGGAPYKAAIFIGAFHDWAWAGLNARKVNSHLRLSSWTTDWTVGFVEMVVAWPAPHEKHYLLMLQSELRSLCKCCLFILVFPQKVQHCQTRRITCFMIHLRFVVRAFGWIYIAIQLIYTSFYVYLCYLMLICTCFYV